MCVSRHVTVVPVLATVRPALKPVVVRVLVVAMSVKPSAIMVSPVPRMNPARPRLQPPVVVDRTHSNCLVMQLLNPMDQSANWNVMTFVPKYFVTVDWLWH